MKLYFIYHPVHFMFSTRGQRKNSLVLLTFSCTIYLEYIWQQPHHNLCHLLFNTFGNNHITIYVTYCLIHLATTTSQLMSPIVLRH